MASSLTLENVKNLYRCACKEERRAVLVQILGYLTHEDEEEDMRASILVDFYLESLNFASEQGFSWQQGLTLFDLMKELREKALSLPLLQATELFRTILKDHVNVFPPDRMTSVVDFVFSLFFHHFHLYKFVFTNERVIDTTCYDLSIKSPPQSLLPLTQGIEKSEWDRQQMLKNLEDEHDKRKTERQSLLDSEVQRLESIIHEQLSSLSANKNLSKEELQSIIAETVKVYVTSAGSTIKRAIEESQENLEYQHSKAAVGQHSGKSNITGTTRSPNAFTAKKKPPKPKTPKG